MTRWQRINKRSFDILVSLIGLCLVIILIAILWIIATIDTKKNGFFLQRRIGQYGKLITIIKIRSMKEVQGFTSTITTSKDPRISSFGGIIRSTKLDELPQLFNVLIGKLSFVGPRPDVPGYADKLEGADRRVLELKPGITGPASLFFRNEEELLGGQSDPQGFNDREIWPRKVSINLDYFEKYSFWYDIKLIVATVSPFFRDQIEERVKKIISEHEQR